MTSPPSRQPLDERAITELLRALPAWRREEAFIVRDYRARSARHALSLIQRLGDVAEGANHHPDLTWVYDRLTIRLTTHDRGGVTSLDFRVAAIFESILEAGAVE